MENTTKQNEAARQIAETIIATEQDLNSFLAALPTGKTGKINSRFGAHYTATDAGVYGIEQLIKAVLKSNEAVFAIGAELTELRPIVIAGAMFSDEIIAQVRRAFGADRYPDQSISNYLSTKAKGLGTVQLKGNEDKNRTCCRPRCKYFLAE